MALSVSFFGTRGSIPTPGPGTVRYGGNTPALLVDAGDGRRLVLDAGTGIRRLAHAVEPDPVDLTILLSHTHWDHIQGLPFFRPLFQPGSSLRIVGPKQPVGSLDEVLRSQMAPAVFPVPLDMIGATVDVTEITESALTLSGFEVTCLPLCHPGATLGYSIRSRTGGPAFTYMTDNELGAPDAAARRPALVRFLQATDVLVHDAMYFEAELAGRRGWGHSGASEAVALAVEAGIGRLVLFHHAPDHDDDTLERLAEEADRARHRMGGSVTVTLAREGDVLHCE